jgi:hypothetical protein
MLLTFWLQIPINKPHQVEILESSSDLGCVESSSIFRDAFPWASLESYSTLFISKQRTTSERPQNAYVTIPRKNSPPLQYSMHR